MSLTRSSRSLGIEQLENRQLLATIVAGHGTEVDSNVTLANGNTYDQILLTGSSITVKADAGQVTRVDFLDQDGDIIRAEISGAGELTVTLTDFKNAAKPTEYVTETRYVQGLASFTITGSDASTNVTLYSLGSVNVHQGSANPLFGGGAKDGGNNVADVSLLTIRSEGVSRDFGGIRAGNAVFGGTSGFVGIAAGDIRFAGPIVLAGISGSDAARPVLQIGQDSPNSTVTLAGTNLAGAAILNGGVRNIIASGGETSMAVARDTLEFIASQAFLNPSQIQSITHVPTAATLTLDGNTTGAQLARYANGFFNDVVVKESFTGTFSAKLIRNISVEGDLGAIVRSGSSISSVVVEGGIVEGGAIEAVDTIGEVRVRGAIDFSGTGYDTPVSAIISTVRGAIGSVTFEADVELANGDVPIISSGGNIERVAGKSMTQTLSSVAVITARGSVESLEMTEDFRIAGSISIAGSLGRLSGGDVETGEITVDGSIGSLVSLGGDLNLGSVTAEGAIELLAATQDLIINGLTSRNGDIGDLIAGHDMVVNGRVAAENGSIGDFSAAGGQLVVNDEISSSQSIGNISVTGTDHDLVFGANGRFVASDRIGNVVISSGGASSNNTGAAEFAARMIGNVSITGHQSTSVLVDDVIFVARGESARIGDIVLNATANSAGAVAASTARATNSVAGAGFSSSGEIGDITITGHEDGRLLVNNGDVLLFRAGNANMGAATADEFSEENTVSIGDVIVRANLADSSSDRGTGLIIAAGVRVSVGGEFVSGSATAVTGPAKAGSGTIGSLTITDLAGAAVTGFDRNALPTTGVFHGGSVIVADAIGRIEIEAGDSIDATATGTPRKGALDTDGDNDFQGVGDLYVLVI